MMKNETILKITDQYMDLRIYVFQCVKEVFNESDIEIKLHNSTISLLFKDFELFVGDYYSVKIINTNKHFTKSDFENMDKLNESINKYNPANKD